ncbi:MAG: hypothetical protein Q7U57_05265 [Methylovulum sp.]|nr:hypothetical protein [Methylovulum sp.]
MTSIAFSILVQACTTQQLYDSAQGARQYDCSKLADSADRTQCFEAANRRYEQYTRDQNDKPKE